MDPLESSIHMRISSMITNARMYQPTSGKVVWVPYVMVRGSCAPPEVRNRTNAGCCPTAHSDSGHRPQPHTLTHVSRVRQLPIAN